MSDGGAILFHVAVVADLLDGLLEDELKPTPLTPREFQVATVLVTRGPMPPGEIATVTGVPAPSISRFLGSMEGRGLVTQSVNPADRRSRIVSLTDEGLSAFAESQAAFQELFRAVATRLGSELAVTDASIHRLEWALRGIAGIDTPVPVEVPSARSHVLHYPGAPLRLEEEAEVLDFIEWLRQRAARRSRRGG